MHRLRQNRACSARRGQGDAGGRLIHGLKPVPQKTGSRLSQPGRLSMSEATHYKVIGTRPIRHDGVDKVTGRAKYGADYAFPGMLFGKVLRSPHAHAIIKSIKLDKALKL